MVILGFSVSILLCGSNPETGGKAAPVDGAPGLGLPALCKVLEAAELEPAEQVSC